MERDMGQLGVDTLSYTSPPFYQHQFFPAGGVELDRPNTVENSNGLVSSANGDRNSGDEVPNPSHWDMKAWNWDPVRFAAQRSGGRGEDTSSDDLRQYVSNGNGESHRASAIGLTLDRPSASEQQGNCNEGDERENRGRSFLERETPSPPFTERQSFPRDDDSPEAVGSLSLKLGADSYAYAEDNEGGSRNRKRNRSSSPQSQIPTCQVDGCKADLSKAKDYHRRHKVCEIHSKAAKASVSRLMQRFCQQCSRFHPLQEFDEGKRSCRRRLAGHNRRRRKTQPDAAAARAYIMAEEERLGKGGSGLIGSLLSILGQLTGTTSLDRFNSPVFDREALLRKAIAASLEDINRTTPLWNQLLSNSQLTSAFGQQVQQLTSSNDHGANLALDTQRLLSRLTGPTPEALLLVLQQSLNAQIAAASITTQNNVGSHMNGANNLGHIPLGSACGMEGQAALLRTSQACVEPTNAGVSHSLLSSPVPARAPPLEIVRPTPMAPVQLQQLNSDQSVQHGVAPVAVQSSFMPYQSVIPPSTNKQVNNGREAATPTHPSTDGRMAPTLPYMARPELQSNMDAPSSSARRGIDLQHPVQQSSDTSQAGSDEQMPSSSNVHVERRNRTRRIAMKLFERNPEELPTDLRSQIDSWLAHLPSDMESYIRPGCLVLTIFVSMPISSWTELDRDLQSSVQKLLNLHTADFWHKGRILVQVERQMVFIVDGQIQERELMESWEYPYIQSVRPLAVEVRQAATITLKGFNLTRSDTRVLCAYQGKYLLQECTDTDLERAEDTPSKDEISLHLDETFTSCGSHSNIVGRCFVEVEHDIILANARPVIIADRFVCSELCKLEEEVEVAASHTRTTARVEGLEPMEVLGCSELARLVIEEDVASFLHELGWYFQKGVYGQQDDRRSLDVVSANRLKCLLIFSVERNWCAVVRKLLDVALESDNMEAGIARLSQVVQDDVSLLHRAVRRKYRSMVELLLTYVPSSLSSESVGDGMDTGHFGKSMEFKLQWCNLFRPDMEGPAGLTPLHIAASMQDGDNIVDALTSDPFQVGLHAWLSKRDLSGNTPLNCAMEGNNQRSIQLVMNKLALLEGSRQQVFINIPPNSYLQTWNQLPPGGLQAEVGRKPAVELAEWVESSSAPAKKVYNYRARSACGSSARRGTQFGGIIGPAFKPFLLSLVAIATVCVCVCIVFKGPPNVAFCMPPFRWEGVHGGPK